MKQAGIALVVDNAMPALYYRDMRDRGYNMSNILFITNMEQNYTGMNQAKDIINKKNRYQNVFSLEQINDSELWTQNWEDEFKKAKFILVSWMGTGLCCDFLKKSSAYMQKKQICHLYNIIDAGDDVLDYGLVGEEKEILQQYLQYGGLQNFSNLWLWLANKFMQVDCQYQLPKQLPWCGIYHPNNKTGSLYSKAYVDLKNSKNRLVIGMIFAREDWLWQRVDYPDQIIDAIERQGAVPFVIFTNTMENLEQNIPGLGQNMREFFYEDGKPIIDVLINNFVFSLTTTGFLALKDLQNLGVPILQAYNLYSNYKYWQNSYVGMTANELSYAIALPEFDGVIHSVPVSTQEEAADGTHYRFVLKDRVQRLIEKAIKWAVLRNKKNIDKKVAIVFHNYPPTNSNIGSAANLDSIESIRLLLIKMKNSGYKVDFLADSNKEFMDALTSHATNDRRFISGKQIREADGKLTRQQYQECFLQLPQEVQAQLIRDWGEPPGTVFCYDDDLLIPGMLNGNIYITVQPPRGFGEDPGKIYHSPDCAPTHHYLAFYHWIQDIWQADVMIHVGTHGNLEWLPGKGVAMSGSCYSDIATGCMPNIYHYWITCVGEGIQAKRRSAACLISYLSAPMSVGGAYEELAEMESLLEEYIHFKQDETAERSQATLENLIREKAAACNLTEDVPEVDDFVVYVGNLHVFITDLKNMQIHTGLHILGQPPQDDEFTEYLLALTKLENGSIPSLTKTVAAMFGYDYYELLENSSKLLPQGDKTYGMLVDEICEKCREVILLLTEKEFVPADASAVLELEWTKQMTEELRQQFLEVARYICEKIAPSLLLTTLETDNTLRALNGAYIEPSASGAPTSGGADLLPTGRNFYSVDPKTLPTMAAWKIGKTMADEVIERFIFEEGHYPESVGIILWATSNLRNHGQCVAEFLYLMGLRPIWQKGSRRVIDLELISLAELKRPRIDVTGRISGLFRDSMVASIDWMNKAVDMVANLDEPMEMNFIRKHVLEESKAMEQEGILPEDAWRQASYRIFGDPPGAHGAGVGDALESKNWESVDDLAKVYVRWGGHAYGDGSAGTYLPKLFERRLGQMEITLQNVDHRESSMLAGDDYNNYRGGMVAAVRSVRGEMPRNYVSDSSDRSKVQIRSLDEELKRWFRGEAMNPKYINGMKKHGYKGAGDLATYVAVSYQWDATSDVMEDWMYEKYAEKYAFDKDMQEWMKKVNPWALHRIAEVLLEAIQRGLWNAKTEIKEELKELFLSMEGELEELNDHE